MRRHCDGKDTNLIRYERKKILISGQQYDAGWKSFHPDKIPNVVEHRYELVARVDHNAYYVYDPTAKPVAVPCDCGLAFDDVRRSTVYPHELI